MIRLATARLGPTLGYCKLVSFFRPGQCIVVMLAMPLAILCFSFCERGLLITITWVVDSAPVVRQFLSRVTFLLLSVFPLFSSRIASGLFGHHCSPRFVRIWWFRLDMYLFLRYFPSFIIGLALASLWHNVVLNGEDFSCFERPFTNDQLEKHGSDVKLASLGQFILRSINSPFDIDRMRIDDGISTWANPFWLEFQSPLGCI